MLGLSPRSKQILERVKKLYPSLIDLSLGRLEALLEKLGRPQDDLPPVFHVAGTNGKGSTCAFLRALGDAAGLRSHILTSPHLIRLNERFRLSGQLVSDDALDEVLAEIEEENAGAPITVFEVLTAAGFLLFSRHEADFAVIEVGMGGKFDATNLVSPAICLITPISFDHQNFLGNELAGIAAEKAGIIKDNVPVYSGIQTGEAFAELQKAAMFHHAPLFRLGEHFQAVGTTGKEEWVFASPRQQGSLPYPSLAGEHQLQNAALACAAFEALFPQDCPKAFQGISAAIWPGRLQKLTGHLQDLLPSEWELWLDGAHNPHGAEFLGHTLKQWRQEMKDCPIYLILGLKEGKKASEILAPLWDWSDKIILTCEENQYLAQPVEQMQEELLMAGGKFQLGEKIGKAHNVKQALQKIAAENAAVQKGKIIICGSLYLAGEVLRQDGFEMV